MRFTAALPVLCTIPALVLAFLCLFAGSSKKFLEHTDILTVSLPSPSTVIQTDNTSSTRLKSGTT